MNSRQWRRLSQLCILGVACFSAQIVEADASLGESLLRQFVTEVTTLSGHFEQSVLDADGVLVDASSGTVEIARPGRFRWTTSEPYEQWVIADGLNLWSYDVDLAQVTVKPQADALSSTPGLLLGGDAKALEEFVVEDSVADGSLVWVRLVPQDDSTGFRRLALGFEDDRLAQMVFLDNLEQRTVVELSDVDYNAALDDTRFEFTPPDDVDIVGTPAVEEMP